MSKSDYRVDELEVEVRELKNLISNLLDQLLSEEFKGEKYELYLVEHEKSDSIQ